MPIVVPDLSQSGNQKLAPPAQPPPAMPPYPEACPHSRSTKSVNVVPPAGSNPIVARQSRAAAEMLTLLTLIAIAQTSSVTDAPASNVTYVPFVAFCTGVTAVPNAAAG